MIKTPNSIYKYRYTYLRHYDDDNNKNNIK